MTPSAWRDGGRGQTIRWTTVDSPSARCWLPRRQGHVPPVVRRREESLRRLFPHAAIVKDDGGLKELVEGALAAVEHPAAMPDLPIDVAGTAFQEAVWRELRRSRPARPAAMPRSPRRSASPRRFAP